MESDFSGPSRTDILYLAHSYVLGFPVVTDDRDMRAVAQAFEIPTHKTLELLKVMVDVDHITLSKVGAIVAYWKYNDDFPADLRADLDQVFAGQVIAD